MDFFDEHVEQLLGEIKKKNRIIQHYVMSLEPGALVTEESDLHKVGRTLGHYCRENNIKNLFTEACPGCNDAG